MASSIDRIAEQYVVDYAAADPITATYLGIAGHEDTLTDYSPDGFAQRDQLTRRTLEQLNATEPVDERERVAKEAMLERLGLDVERYEAGILTSELNVVASPLQDARQVFDLMPTEGTDAWTNIGARLSRFPQALASYRRTLAEEAAKGRVAARRQVTACATQCRSWLDPDADVFAGLIAQCELSGPIRAAVERGAAAARAAVAEFASFLDAELAPSAHPRDAVGPELYQLGSRYFLGATVDLAETYAWGWDELDRIEREAATVADRIVPGGTVDEAAAKLDADPARQIDDKEAFRAWMQELSDRSISDLADVHFDIPEPIRRLECCIAPTSDGVIYYTGPSEDFARPGRMWWSVPKGVNSFATWREVTTVYHEGVPGHHLQVAQTAYRKEAVNRWQRLMCWVSGHGEGWALYAERLMDELGYLDEPGAKLGMLDAQGFRAARVVIDIGMHLELPIPAGTGWHEGERWTPDLGLEFLRKHLRLDDEFRQFELNRYLGWPGQAPSYKIGERSWLEARAEAKQRKGAAFDLKSFHRSALDLGSIGLDPFRRALARL